MMGKAKTIADRLSRHYPVGLAAEAKICNACECTWPCDVALALQWVNPAPEEIAALRERAELWEAWCASPDGGGRGR